MTPAAVADLVRSFADDVLTGRGLDPAVLPATIIVERPRKPEHGDYATNVALQTATRAGVTPRELAGWLAEALVTSPAVRSAEVAGPGFLNIRLARAAQLDIIGQVLTAGDGFGTGTGPSSLRWRGPWPAEDDVRYAHSRLASLARNAADLGVTAADAQLGLLRQAPEAELIATLSEFPLAVASAAQLDQPLRLARYLERLAPSHQLFSSCLLLPMGDEEPGPSHGARLALCQATRQVLANGLALLGVDAPELM